MLTPQEITEKAFTKAFVGGYDMTEVDDFLESINADYAALYKENAILKGKLKVLVEKVEEYRSTEDSMRMALLTAQRMGEEITTEANKIKEETLRKTDLEIKAKLDETAKRISDEQLRLSVAAKETGRFIELSQAIMRKHTEFLSRLETATRAVLPDSASQQVVSSEEIIRPSHEDQIAETADEIGDVMDKITGNGSSTSSLSEYSEDTIDIAIARNDTDDNDDDALVGVYASDGEEEQDTMTPRPRFDFDDLRFGSNVNSEDDDD
ncbi:MAG: DivIVA domain-containing protein [Oscillospiraceae bacterium]|nr:DivIVA domain-containing protein [Oscillospiraceae bacterium]